MAFADIPVPLSHCSTHICVEYLTTVEHAAQAPRVSTYDEYFFSSLFLRVSVLCNQILDSMALLGGFSVQYYVSSSVRT